ncbi:hypothetical protein WCX72_08780 [Sulfurimonas sp. HSL1-6]|uniref:THUMP domain-containing protein n=1 Tax=Thiomicrolovo immobilis TaxID=3131935 RepID=UPI0031F82C7E
MEKTYQVVFSREIEDNRVTVECTVKAKTFGEAERLACKKISGNYFKAALTGDHANDDMKSADYIIDIYIIDDTDTLNENEN